MESIGNETYNIVILAIMALITLVVLKMPKRKD